MKHKASHYIKFRPFRIIYATLEIIGLVLVYFAFERANQMFGSPEQGIQLFYSKEQMSWIPSHYGQIGVFFIGLAFVFKIADHFAAANKQTPL